jgi:formyltetrahydrofolate hydrolase
MPIGRTAFNTSTNIVNLRTTGLAASDTYFKSLSLKINNNASPEKVLGRLGAAVIDMGRFKVEIQSNVIFAGPDIITNIRNNVTCTMDFLLRNENGAIAVDIPSLKFSGGGRTYPQDKSVLMDITANAHQDDSLGTSIGISLFQYLP